MKRTPRGETNPMPGAGGNAAENQYLDGSTGAQRPGMLSYKPVGALLAGLSVLRYIAASPTPLPLAQIARDLKLNPSTCLNILRTLSQEGYLTIDYNSKLYSMGLGVLELVGGALALGGDLRPIRAITDVIAIEEHVTVTLWRRVKSDRKILVLESLPVDGISIKMGVGQRLPLLVGAAGKLWAGNSGLTEADLKAQFKELRLERRPPFKEFIAEAEAAIAQGWALDEGDYTLGATSVSVPVVDDKGHLIFAFTATMFSQQFNRDRIEPIVAKLRRPASLLSSALSYL